MILKENRDDGEYRGINEHGENEVKQGEYIKHRNFDMWDDGLNHTMDGREANTIIEEIITLLISKGITVACATSILEDTISSIKKEALLEKRKIGNEII